MVATPTAAQSDKYAVAEAFAGRGDGPGMERAYGAILATDPNDVRALIGRGTAHSWQGERAQARRDFGHALFLEPNNLSALNGLGYDYLWGEEYRRAENTFARALRIAPNDLGARKGLAFAALWSERAELAQTRFGAIISDHPDDAEAHVGFAQAQLKLGHPGKAAEAYRSALHIDPNREDARKGLQATYDYPPWADATVLWGYTSSSSETGLRIVEAGVRPTPEWRVYGRYDNSLSLDNAALARTGQEVKTYFVGSQYDFEGDWLVAGEVGHRDLPDGEEQYIFKAEAVYFDEGWSYKGLVQLSPHSAGYTEEAALAIVNAPLAPNWRIEGLVGLAENGEAEDIEGRANLRLEHISPDRWTVGVGGGAGYIDSDIAGVSGPVYVAAANATLPIFNHHTLRFGVDYEKTPTSERTVILGGVTLRLPRH